MNKTSTKVATGFAAYHTLRTFVRLAVSIGLTAALDKVIGGGLGPLSSVAIVGGLHSVLTFVQNWVEAKGVSPQMFGFILKAVQQWVANWSGATPNTNLKLCYFYPKAV